MRRLTRSHRFDASVHDVSQFDCGNASLNRWLQQHAVVAYSMKTAVTYVWVSDGRVVGYYAVSPHALLRSDAPKPVARNAPDPVPAFLLAKLAVDQSFQGGGQGALLLHDALARLVGAASDVAGRIVLVDAIDAQARDFYLAHGFADVPNHSMRLYLKMTDAEAAVSAVLDT